MLGCFGLILGQTHHLASWTVAATGERPRLHLCALAALREIFLGFSGGRSVAFKTILQFERIYLAKPVFF